MAKGDVICNVNATGGDSALDVKPAAGTAYLITTVTTAGDGANAGWAAIKVGVNVAQPFLHPGHNIGEGNTTNQAMRDGKVFVHDNAWLRIYNENAGVVYTLYSGVMWK